MIIGVATMIIYWQMAIELFFLIGELLFQNFSRRILIYGVIQNISLGRTASNNDSWTITFKKRLLLTKNIVSVSNTNIINKKSLNNKEKKKEISEGVEFPKQHQKFINKRDVFSIDAKYRNQIVVHCSDVDSYYLATLNECYRIYQTPYNNLDPSYIGNRNMLAYGMSQFDYMYNCWELYHGKLLDIGEMAIGEKMQLVKKMALQFYHTTGQQDAIRVGFMISKNYEMMTQNGTFYDILDGVYVKMNSTEPCDNVCCIVIKLVGIDEVEMEQASCDHAFIPNFFCQKRGNTPKSSSVIQSTASLNIHLFLLSTSIYLANCFIAICN